LKQLKGVLEKVDKRDKEDINALAKDVIKLQKDVHYLKLKHI
jgi:hypothetical protein